MKRSRVLVRCILGHAVKALIVSASHRRQVRRLVLIGVAATLALAVAATAIARPAASTTAAARALTTVSGSITAGVPTTVTTTTPGETAELTFSGSNGQRVFVRFTNNTINTGFNSARAYILKPDGNTLALGAQIDSSPYGGVYFRNTVIDTVTLPVNGSYKLILVPTATQTGSVTVTLFDVPADPTASLAPASGAGSSTTVTSATPGQNLAVTFTGTAGQRILAQFTNNTINTGFNSARAYIVKPDGSTLALGTQIDSSPYGGVYFRNTVIDTVTLPAGGTYTLIADPERTQVGSATFTLYDVPADATTSIAPTSGAGSSGSLTTTTAGQNLAVTFAGTAGQRILAQFTNNTINSGFNSARAYILNPDGSTLALGSQIDSSPYGGVYFRNTVIDTVALPVSGTYTLVADPERTQIGGATFTLYDVPADPSPGLDD